MRLNNAFGAIIEIRFIKIEALWHARIVGERLTNCGIEWPMFVTWEDEPPPNNYYCSECDRVVKMIISIKRSE